MREAPEASCAPWWQAETGAVGREVESSQGIPRVVAFCEKNYRNIFMFQFQDVYKAPFDDTTFHAGLRGSAICSFRLEDMETVFDGKFKEQASR
jgi:hypothetical protein